MKVIYCFVVYELESMKCMIGCLCMMLVPWDLSDLVGETCTKCG